MRVVSLRYVTLAQCKGGDLQNFAVLENEINALQKWLMCALVLVTNSVSCWWPGGSNNFQFEDFSAQFLSTRLLSKQDMKIPVFICYGESSPAGLSCWTKMNCEC